MTAGHILLVDDEPGIVNALRPALRAAGHTVTVAIDGTAAIAGVSLRDPDVVLLDLGLPDMDGKDVIRAIRATHRTPIIVISARHHEGEKIAALDEGADDYVDKPFVLGELLARVRSLLLLCIVLSAGLFLLVSHWIDRTVAGPIRAASRTG